MKLSQLFENVQPNMPTRLFHETNYQLAMTVLQTGSIKALWDVKPELEKEFMDDYDGDPKDLHMYTKRVVYATAFTHTPHGHQYFGGAHNSKTLAMFLIDATKLPQYPNDIEFYPDMEGGLAVIAGAIPVSAIVGVFIEKPNGVDNAVAELAELCQKMNLPVEVGDSKARSAAIERFKA